MSSCIKKLVCVYTDEFDTENCDTLIDYLNNNINLAENNISIIKVRAGHKRDEFVGDTLFLNCKESYDSLSVKTYEMIRMCTQHRDFDFLIKVDSSIVGYGNRENVGYSKRVRSFFYNLKRIKFLLENDFKFREFCDYGGLHRTLSGGSKSGYDKWAEQKNVGMDYDKGFGEETPPPKYTGKLYFMSRKLCNQIVCTGYKTSRDHVKYLGGSEDTLVARIYGRYYKENWHEDTEYQVEAEKFLNFRENTTHGRYKSLYIINHEKKYIWYVNPKCASRTISTYLGVKFPKKYNEKSKDEIVETHGYLDNTKYFDYFKFTFVRNPYDRLLSVFHDKTKKVIGTDWELPYFAKFKDFTFDEFVSYLYENENLNSNDCNRHIRTQYSLANDLQDVNFIGRCENLSSDLQTIDSVLGLTGGPVLNKNTTKHQKWASYYQDEEIRSKVAKMYHEDFNFFNYKKELS